MVTTLGLSGSETANRCEKVCPFPFGYSIIRGEAS